MTQIHTDLLITRESARRIRVEPTTAVGGTISQTNVQRALEQIAGFIAPVNTTIIATPAVIPATVSAVYFNVGSAVTATLPDAATWATNFTGSLLLKDISGAAATNNITINRAGSNTIDGLTTFQILSNYGFFSLRVVSGNWTFVG